MILFCDTSAVVKLYVEETSSDTVRERVDEAEAVAISRISWAEFHAATARRARESPVDAEAIERARSLFAADWERFLVVELSQRVVVRAGELADAFALRAYDAVQLATAVIVGEETGRDDVGFCCFDRRLDQAARILGLSTAAA